MSPGPSERNPASSQPSLPDVGVVGVDPISTRRVLALGLASAAFVALSVTAQTYLSMLDHGHVFWRMLTWQLSSWGLWALLAPAVLRVGGSPPAPGRFHRPVTIVGLGILFIATHIAITAELAVWILPFAPVLTYGFRQALLNQLGSQFATDVLVYAMLLLLGRIIAVSDRARQLALRESRLEAELVRANLDALRLEIQPHFLFNTLNSIAALIRLRANDKALDMLLGLSGLMRATLDRPVEHVTPLSSEIEFVKQYVDLQAARFGDRLQVRYAVGSQCPAIPVPTFLLQPLVENALRHGIARKAGPSRIEIGAALERGSLHVWVTDDGAGLPPGFSLDRDAGTGLRNIRVRLNQLYGPAGRLEVTPESTGGTRVTIVLPSAPVDALAQASA